MRGPEQQFNALKPDSPEGETTEPREESEAPAPGASYEQTPINETERSISYLGVELEKAQNRDSEFVPKRESYGDYINDDFSLKLQQKLAVSFKQGDPVLVEGGTSIGKTTTVRKMAAELGWEVHYVNLNGATDVEDLMGRYIPNAQRVKLGDPEYVFADGKVTSGLRPEEGKKKVIILDELNAAAPNILIRLHEVIDALERGGDVVLSEDASERLETSKDLTKIVGLTNPPGKGYLGREPLDPAQLRRWVYQKEVTDLPDKAFSHAIDTMFTQAPELNGIEREQYLSTRKDALLPEQLAEIPGIAEISEKFKEFHRAARELLKERHIGADQPQPFTFDDRMEPKRVRDFILRFYSGDINETFQRALRYYYANKLESDEDREKLEELVRNVEYVPGLEETKRKGLDEGNLFFTSPEGERVDYERVPYTEGDATYQPGQVLKGKDGELYVLEGVAAATGEPVLKPYVPEAAESVPESLERADLTEAREVLGRDVIGPEQIEKTFGVKLKEVPAIPFSKAELERAKELGQMLVLRIDSLEKGKPLSLKSLHETLSPRFEKEGKGEVLYNVADKEKWMGEETFTKETPKAGWALTSKEVVPGSTSKNYLEQTEALIDHLKTKVFKGASMPKPYQEAIKEFERQKKTLTDLMSSDWKEAAKRLSELKITQLTRQSVVEAIYDLAVSYDATGERLLPDRYTWTSSRSQAGRLVFVGRFGERGVYGSRWRPGRADGRLGVSLSRSV